jgi:hypothetical protein
MAAKNMQLRTAVMPKPPRICPTSERANRIRRSTKPPFSMSLAARKKKGTAMSVK